MDPRARLAEVETALRSIHETAGDNDLTTEQQTEWDALQAERNTLTESIERADRQREERRALAELTARSAGNRQTGDGADAAMRTNRESDPFEILRSNRHASRQELTSANLRAVQDVMTEDRDAQRHFEQIVRRHAGDQQWARNILARSHPDYTTAFSKLVTGRSHLLTQEEIRAAMAVGTNTAGGFMVPTHLDPTLILTNSGVSNVIRGISRVVTLTDGANVWNGITTAGATASWDAELTEVSDDTPPVAKVSVPIYKAQSLIQASIEAFEDISSLTSDVAMLLADAKDRLEAAAHATGSGSGQPTGIFTALDANTNVEIISTTANVVGVVDLHNVYRQLPVRWRGRSTWLMNPLFALGIKALGTALGNAYTGDLTQGTADRLLNRPVVESDEAPSAQTTTANDNAAILGDFSNFVIVDKPGSAAIEFIPHMFNTSNNLPDGRRAWYMHWRNGSDSVNDLAFRLLQEKTSA